MSKVFFSLTLSLDGLIAPSGMDMEHADNPGYQDWLNRWMALQSWIFPLRFFRESLKLGEGGDTGVDNEIAQATFHRTGVSIMGKRMFEGGERFWPEEAPFHTPVFVLTHQSREPWQRPGGTTFHFVNDGIHSALAQARAASGGRDIRIAGGADIILQYLNAGLVDEFSIALAPVFLGEGVRLFEGIDASRISVDLIETIPSSAVTHLHYAVKTRGGPA